jgi:acyl-CoA dehydrogenase
MSQVNIRLQNSWRKNVRIFHMQVSQRYLQRPGIPADTIYEAQLGEGKDRWSEPSIVEHLKGRAKELGLWNMFLAKGHYKEGAGFTNLEYGLMAEYLGRSRTASEVGCTFSCLKFPN